MASSNPDTKLAALDDPEVDWPALMAEMRASASERHHAVGYDQPAASAGESGSIQPIPAGPPLSPVEGTATIRPYPSAEAARASQSVSRRLVRRILRWYLWPVTAALTTHNEAASAVLAEHRRHLSLLAMSVDRAGRDLDRLGPGTS